MRTVPLGGKKARGRVALVDNADYDLVSRHNWHVLEVDRGAYLKTAGPYAQTHIRRPDGRDTTTYMHSLITGLRGVDHIDLDGLNNQRYNLRAADASHNGANQAPYTWRDGQPVTSAYKGVCRFRNKWQAHIRVRGHQRNLGVFDNEVAAAYAYDTAALEAWGEYARINFPAG